MNKIDKLIEEAKAVAKKDYEDRCIEGNYHNPEAKREWLEKANDKVVVLALDGTPPKAFVLLNKEKKVIEARNQWNKMIQKWEY